MPNPMREALVPDAPRIERDGSLRVPTGPGLGVQVDPEALRAFALEV
jgi:L-alanine-DL-glutamate epimerase-like enolase superfamily enzyme